MTQYELTAKIESFRIVPFDPLINALCAVVELHKSDGSFCVECSHDTETLIYYPCSTIMAIEKEINHG